jgi:6-phosphofructokinase 1
VNHRNDHHDLLVLQGGGPTPVFNATLYGIIDQTGHESSRIGRVLGARNGVEGLIKNDLVELTDLPVGQLESLKHSPGASLGSTRHRLLDADLEQIVENLGRLDVHRLLVIGGNGSLHGADLIGQAAERKGHDLRVIGVPKTIDNDIPDTDRCPGFASAARYVAQSVRDLTVDVRALPQPVSIFETMGRDAGWVAGASLLARMDDDDGPHLVYLPERPFTIDAFLGDVDRVVRRQGFAVVVANEGIRNLTGQRVFENTSQSQRDALGRGIPGGVAAHLAGEVTRRLKIRCRWEQPGLCGRASMLHVSKQDLIDAEAVGRAAVRVALQEDHQRHMIALDPLAASASGDSGYSSPLTHAVPLPRAAAQCRQLPAEWLGNSSEFPVDDEFLGYVRPLVGSLLEYAPLLRDVAPRMRAERQVPA